MLEHQAPAPAPRQAASQDDQTDRRATGRRGQRVVKVRLDRRRHGLLHELAAEAGVTGEQLAALWIGERIDELAGAQALARAAEELGDIRAALLELAAQRGASIDPAADGPSSRPAGQRESLHGEIVTVLAQRGEPMTAAEIAAVIRQRGQYRAPRSRKPISGAAVSRRIANPYYRSLFERRGRHVRLAADPAG